MELNCRTKTLWSGQTGTSATMRSRSTMMWFGFKWQWHRRSSLSLVSLRSDQLISENFVAGQRRVWKCSAVGVEGEVVLLHRTLPNAHPRKPELNVNVSEWELMVVKYYNLLSQCMQLVRSCNWANFRTPNLSEISKTVKLSLNIYKTFLSRQ